MPPTMPAAEIADGGGSSGEAVDPPVDAGGEVVEELVAALKSLWAGSAGVDDERGGGAGAVERGGLENRCPSYGDRGFESPPSPPAIPKIVIKSIS